ncbi:7,8-didemethyl-8-hydroxy-5-deazariboflavin synthase CofG [Methanobacterium alcaliphilum]|uniref:7,8-didemethyl-8-hydroxy-5-deazariboflavin synthase CofG n=1 Tax=Methanobacterium alcaliphilum TaxID=392018 RepID=UPI00200A5665|nr:7,8-didemethyl-8-hydroxy-5-deazariboflavin synthase CofG [Methanobacterium alcaliphilum]MCK9151502.1 7,8-didemethyl-8-hydroxy-5-deazariboflavin synthase CofG [Methanobacterium alcaliphilum]
MNPPKMLKEDILLLLNSKKNKILDLMNLANSKGENSVITYSKNAFIPLTEICRNECGYCTFRRDPQDPLACILMHPHDVLERLNEAEKYGCKEALFTFGERSDEISQVKNVLDELGFESMVEYLYHISYETLKKTNLLPHSNPGVLNRKELKMLKEVNASMGMMLESTSSNLMKSLAHKKSPGKNPWLRIQTIENAGKLRIPFTTGLLIGIGETLEDRAESLMELRRIQDKYGHIQEIIIQNFRSKPGIPMENHPEPSLVEMVKTVAVAKLLFPDVSIQVPPNLNRENAQIFLLAGCDDWGGVSPLTHDYVNPEAPWPEIEELTKITEDVGFSLSERLPVYSKYISSEFLSDIVLEKIDSMNFK